MESLKTLVNDPASFRDLKAGDGEIMSVMGERLERSIFGEGGESEAEEKEREGNVEEQEEED